MKERIGFYICHCGTNIAGKVRVQEVRDYISSLKGVIVSRDYLFMCSDPGQELIEKDIRDYELTRVVVASCSPRMHERTFRAACQRAGLNPYKGFHMVCIREHCSWVTEDENEATEKAKDLCRAGIMRVLFHEELETKVVPVNPDVLVVGGGIAGMQAALDIAEAGYKVYLVEKQPTIGGHMLQFDKTFPTLDCASCIGTPKMVSVGQHPNIELMTYSEIEEVNGFVGNFKVKVKRKPRYVNIEKCTGCGECGTLTVTEKHPIKKVNGRLWVDRIDIDEAKCIHCGKCLRACLKENGARHGLSNIVFERLKNASQDKKLEKPSLFQDLLMKDKKDQKEFWEKQFKRCIKCYGCIDMCPVYLERPDSLDIKERVAQGEVPPDPAFHILRAYNVWDSCVGCGECERTCPANIPLKTLQDIVQYLDPQEVFEILPVDDDIKDDILALTENRKEFSRRFEYAV